MKRKITLSEFLKLSRFCSHHEIVNTRFYFAAAAASGGLKWVRVDVPSYQMPGETATLHCEYELGNDTLYSVKWYKEHEEFYSFVPKQSPKAHSYHVTGVHVDVSTHKIVTIIIFRNLFLL